MTKFVAFRKNAKRFLENPLWKAIELVAVIAAVWAFFIDLGERDDDRINSAWQLLYLSSEKGGDGMRDSMEFLNQKKRSFQGMNLSGSFLSGADLSNADLRKVNFHDANLVNVDFSGAQLIGIDLRGAKLYNAKGLENLNFDQIDAWDHDTSWPEGIEPPSKNKESSNQ